MSEHTSHRSRMWPWVVGSIAAVMAGIVQLGIASWVMWEEGVQADGTGTGGNILLPSGTIPLGLAAGFFLGSLIMVRAAYRRRPGARPTEAPNP